MGRKTANVVTVPSVDEWDIDAGDRFASVLKGNVYFEVQCRFDDTWTYIVDYTPVNLPRDGEYRDERSFDPEGPISTRDAVYWVIDDLKDETYDTSEYYASAKTASEGSYVWCTDVNDTAWASNGVCQVCGDRTHKEIDYAATEATGDQYGEGVRPVYVSTKTADFADMLNDHQNNGNVAAQRLEAEHPGWEVIIRSEYNLVSLCKFIGDYDSLAVRYDSETREMTWEYVKGLNRVVGGPCDSIDEGIVLCLLALESNKTSTTSVSGDTMQITTKEAQAILARRKVSSVPAGYGWIQDTIGYVLVSDYKSGGGEYLVPFASAGAYAEKDGFYFYVEDGKEHQTSGGRNLATLEEAKAGAEAGLNDLLSRTASVKKTASVSIPDADDWYIESTSASVFSDNVFFSVEEDFDGSWLYLVEYSPSDMTQMYDVAMDQGRVLADNAEDAIRSFVRAVGDVSYDTSPYYDSSHEASRKTADVDGYNDWELDETGDQDSWYLIKKGDEQDWLETYAIVHTGPIEAVVGYSNGTAPDLSTGFSSVDEAKAWAEKRVVSGGAPLW